MSEELAARRSMTPPDYLDSVRIVTVGSAAVSHGEYKEMALSTRARRWALFGTFLVSVALVVAYLFAFVLTPPLSPTAPSCAATSSNCKGFIYRGICLRFIRSSLAARDIPPSTCSVYQPAANWERADYLAICANLSGISTCNNVDMVQGGGRCDNYRAVLAFDTMGTSLVVWVNSASFRWNPVPSNETQSSCKLPSLTGSILVYACSHQCQVSSQLAGPASPNNKSVTVAPGACSGGLLYKGVCLKSSVVSSNVEVVPADCDPYQPRLAWSYADYVALCSHFGGTMQCRFFDTGVHNGRCPNGRAILAYDSNAFPVVWVSSKTFAWNPGSSVTPSCRQINLPPGTLIFACRNSQGVVTPAPPVCEGGLLHKGVCLRSSTVNSAIDSIPSDCVPYQPKASWTFSDYIAVCRHFSSSLSCGSVDADFHGGRCSNYLAVLAYENNHFPDVWVSKSTFSWNPSTSTSPNCLLVPDPPGTVVYACLNNADVPTISATPSPSCVGGFTYKGICLQSVTTGGSVDAVPPGCVPYQPRVAWTFLDYVTICTHVGKSPSCVTYDADAHGGRCRNYRAILSFENNPYPDVWVHRDTFTWDPSPGRSPDCDLVTHPPGTLVYACRTDITTTTSSTVSEISTLASPTASSTTVATATVRSSAATMTSPATRTTSPATVVTSPLEQATSSSGPSANPITTSMQVTTNTGAANTTTGGSPCDSCHANTICCTTHCLCPYQYAGANCDKANYYVPARFHGNSFMAFTYFSSSAEEEEILFIIFQTVRNSSLLWYVTGAADYSLMGIDQAGHLFYKQNIDGNELSLVSPSMVADDADHIATISRGGGSVDMEIDHQIVATSPQPNGTSSLDVAGGAQVLVGGLDYGVRQCVASTYTINGTNFDSGFDGCIFYMIQNGAILDLQAPAAGVNISPCS